jgi:hypothetical protein
MRRPLALIEEVQNIFAEKLYLTRSQDCGELFLAKVGEHPRGEVSSGNLRHA